MVKQNVLFLPTVISPGYLSCKFPLKTVYFSVSLETFRLGDSEAVSFFDLTRQNQPLKVMQFLKNRLRLVGSGQTFPEIIPELCNPLAQEARQQTRSASCHTARRICAHTSVYTFSHAHSLTTPWSYLAGVGLCQYWRKKEQQKEKKEGMTF